VHGILVSVRLQYRLVDKLAAGKFVEPIAHKKKVLLATEPFF